MEVLKSYYEEQLAQFKAKKLDAAQTIAVGEYPHAEKLDANLTAALMKAIDAIYNLEETLTKA